MTLAEQSNQQFTLSENKHDLLKELLQNMPTPAVITALNGEIIFANTSAIELLALHKDKRSETFSNNGWKMIDEDHKEISQKKRPMVLTFEKEKPLYFSCIGWQKGGITKWFSLNTMPILNLENKIEHAIGYYTEIPEKSQKHQYNPAIDLKDILNHSDNAYVLLDRNKKVITSNNRAIGLFKLTFHELLEEELLITDHLEEPYLAQFNADFATALRNRPVKREFHLKSKNKKVSWFRISYHPIIDLVSEKVERVAIDVSNITQHVLLKEKLADINEELEEIMNSSIKSFVIIDKDYKTIKYNKIADNDVQKYFGKKLRKNESYLPLIPEESRSNFEEYVRLALRGQRTKVEESLEVGLGVKHYFEMEYIPSLNKRTKKNNVCIATMNVTEQRMVRHSLLRSLTELNKYKTAFFNSSFIAITDVEGNILDINEKFSTLSGYSRMELFGKNMRILNSGYHPKLFFTKMFDALLRGEMYTTQILNKGKNGFLYWIEMTICPVKDDSGKISEFISISYPINELKEAVTQLQGFADRYFLEQKKP